MQVPQAARLSRRVGNSGQFALLQALGSWIPFSQPKQTGALDTSSLSTRACILHVKFVQHHHNIAGLDKPLAADECSEEELNKSEHATPVFSLTHSWHRQSVAHRNGECFQRPLRHIDLRLSYLGTLFWFDNSIRLSPPCLRQAPAQHLQTNSTTSHC